MRGMQRFCIHVIYFVPYILFLIVQLDEGYAEVLHILSHVLAIETYVCGKRDLCKRQKRPMHGRLHVAYRVHCTVRERDTHT